MKLVVEKPPFKCQFCQRGPDEVHPVSRFSQRDYPAENWYDVCLDCTLMDASGVRLGVKYKNETQ